MIATNSPSASSRSTPRSARTGASSASNVLRALRTVSTGSITFLRSSHRARTPRRASLAPSPVCTSSWRSVADPPAARPTVCSLTTVVPAGRARSCSRCAMFTVSPTTVYSSRSVAPEQRGRDLAGREADAEPERLEALGLPRLVQLRLRARASRTAVWAACTAWSSCGNGAPNTAITASPTYCITVPPWSRIAAFISARCRLSWPGEHGRVAALRDARVARARPT